jgi:Flp pilus assembly secretin CpaC
MESSARILRASVADPDLARAVEIDDHELLLNGKAVGRTIVTVWQEGGAEKRFDLHIEQGQAGLPDADMRQDGGPALTAAYESAMARVETAITGVNR